MTTVTKIIAFFMTGLLLLGGCGVKEPAVTPATPRETAECIMESIKTLDMKTFNQYTDNYIQTYHNWIGIVTETEYQVFNELLQPQSKHSKRYQTSYKLDQKITEQLTWEITQVRENGDTAEIDMIITNIDMQKVLNTYEETLIENMLKKPETGIIQLIHDTITVKNTLISIIENLDPQDILTIDVTVTAYQESGQWKIHLNPDFINAFSGNMYTEDENTVNQRLAELERWAEQFEDQMLYPGIE